ncbi:GTPase-activating protein CdGAPr [Papilio machaon]|uniref:GTPase-activating protein CdGAPr n=1 Tax=Papilio machaon TaxID=76193 RepID=A0A194RIQ0_PAPMA|nr:GTPase-activating protein CdGAPr [Papilio machaon]
MRRVFGVCSDGWVLCGQNGSPHGSVMSCQSLAARAFAEPDKDPAQCGAFHRSVRFSSESRSSTRVSNDTDKRDTSGGMSVSALGVAPLPAAIAMSQSAPPPSISFDLHDESPPPVPSCRFPKLEECAHFHYERVSLGGLSIQTVPCEEQCEDNDPSEGWICLRVRSHVSGGEQESGGGAGAAAGAGEPHSWSEPAGLSEWTLTRSRDNFLQLDDMLHRCIYDRKVSGLPNLSEEVGAGCEETRYQQLIGDYVHHLSIIADDSINCGPVLNWLQMDNKGHKLLVANEDSSSINTPAVAAAYSVRKYVSQSSVWCMTYCSIAAEVLVLSGPQESVWWRGKRGFRVGFFPRHCVAVIGDKVPRHMTQPPPIVGSVAVAPIKPVLRKHGKLISLFRSFILSRPSRRSLKQQGILKERVFGCDLGEHLLNCGHDVPQVLAECARAIERRGAVDGIYRLSGGAALTQRLRAAFDAAGDTPPDLAPPLQRDPHALASLLKMYFRELPNPLCTYQLYESFCSAVQQPDDAARLRAMTDTVVKLPPPHYRTLSYLMRHLRRVSLLSAATGMTARNMAIVWAPNLLRSPAPQHALQGVAVQAVVTEFLICYAEDLFAQDQGSDSGPDSLEQCYVPQVLAECARAIERRGAVDGIYRLSGGAALTQRLRAAFDAAGDTPPDLAPPLQRDPHALASLLKMYFRELPNPLCTYQLYESFVSAVQQPDEAARLRAMRDTVVKLPPPHYRLTTALFRGPLSGALAPSHSMERPPKRPKSSVTSQSGNNNEVTARAEASEGAYYYLTRFRLSAICARPPPSPLRGTESCRRPKSLPLNPPTKLLSLEEARRRGLGAGAGPSAPPASGAIAAAAAAPLTSPAQDRQLRPAGHLKPKYIEVGSGPNNLPQYHTVLDLPLSGGKRGLKRSPSGWRGLFWRSKLQRARAPPQGPPPAPLPPPAQQVSADVVMSASLRPVKSCESLASDTDTLPPLADRASAPLKHHTRSSSCDSYFEPWQAELAHMRLRLSPQERDRHMFIAYLPTLKPNMTLAENGTRPGKVKPHLATAAFTIPYLSTLITPVSHGTAKKDLERNSPRKSKAASRYSGLHHPVLVDPDNTRLTWHGKDGHSTLIKIDWPLENSSVSNLTTSTINSSPLTPVTPLYDPLESDSELSDNKHTIQIKTVDCESCDREKCLKCELKATDYENMRLSHELSEGTLRDSTQHSPAHSAHSPHSLHSADISYHNLNRLSALSASSNSDHTDRRRDQDALKVMTSSHDSSSSYSNASLPRPTDDLYECFNFSRPNYINLQSSSTSKSSPGSPLKSPLKSTISITFRSPTKSKSSDYEPIDNIDTPTNDRDSVYEDIDLEKNLSIVEEAPVPETDASLPTQQACQPDCSEDLIILETPTDTTHIDENVDVYSQVKFFRKSIEEVNAMILESPEKDTHDKIAEEPNAMMLESPEAQRHYENVVFIESRDREYENINVDTLKICDKLDISEVNEHKSDPEQETLEFDNGNVIKQKTVSKNLNVRELAIRFESPTEQKGPFNFDKFKTEIKYPSLERKDDDKCESRKKEVTVKLPPPVSPKTYKLSKNSARSLDENAFVKEFGNETNDRRKSLEVKEASKQTNNLPDLNLNTEEAETKPDSITPTTENKISIVQRFELKKPDLRNLIDIETEKNLSRERIEKYKEERRNFLREKYSSQSFRSNPEQLTRIKIKKDPEERTEMCERLQDDLPKFERRNTVDLGQRMRFSLAKSSNNLDTIQSPESPIPDLDTTNLEFSRKEDNKRDVRREERKEKMSPSFNIRDMAALFEQKSHNSNG